MEMIDDQEWASEFDSILNYTAIIALRIRFCVCFDWQMRVNLFFFFFLRETGVTSSRLPSCHCGYLFVLCCGVLALDNLHVALFHSTAFVLFYFFFLKKKKTSLKWNVTILKIFPIFCRKQRKEITHCETMEESFQNKNYIKILIFFNTDLILTGFFSSDLN